MKKLSILLLLAVLLTALCAAVSAENLDSHFTATFNKSPAVYTGPGTGYLRVGRAQYGGGGQARVYGDEGSWMLIGYENAKGNYRIGYIPKKLVNNMRTKQTNYNLRRLRFNYETVTITSGCNITDDPVLKYEPFGYLSSGTSCTYLASYNGSWAYIETYVDGKKARGFVPIGSVSNYSGGYYSTPAQAPVYPQVPASSSGRNARLLMRLSTRSGPSTRYDEPGTFFQNSWQSTTVKVLGKSWDSGNNIWWVLVDFSSGGARYRAWTGLKRVDVNINSVPEIYSIGEGTVSATDAWRGPGSNYAKAPRISSWKDVIAFSRENGYVEVEYYNPGNDRIYRCWVPESKAQITYR